jgi:diguanylate cyclase (GGDEF)-like protein
VAALALTAMGLLTRPQASGGQDARRLALAVAVASADLEGDALRAHLAPLLTKEQAGLARLAIRRGGASVLQWQAQGIRAGASASAAAGDVQVQLALAQPAVPVPELLRVPVGLIAVLAAAALAGGLGYRAGRARERTLRARRTGRRIRFLASHDHLTKLPNRTRFEALLDQALERGRAGTAPRLAVLYVDLDRFREVNDTLGHRLGDRVIKQLSARLAGALPAEAVLGRLAGDELGVVIEGLPAGGGHGEHLAKLARGALDEIGRVLLIGGHEVFMTASIGIALFPGDGASSQELIRNAGAAMLRSKDEGGNTYVFYAAEMNAQADERVMLKGKLRQAVERDELVIRYQPKVDLADGLIVGAEALLRWRLPGLGEISPSRFIPLAEQSSLIQEIGYWVLNQVCRDYRQMQTRSADPGRISINLSLRQLRQASFIVRASSVFQRHEVSPTAFELEITETTLMADGPRTVALLQELADMGLHLSIDDFGTGYSSLAALRQFPIDTVKIDQAFVRHVSRDEADAAIVRTIIAMGRSLGFDVIAEGVESRAQLAFLRDNGCHLAQGRLFGEPLALEELLALMARQAAGSPPFASLLHAPTPAHVG